MRIFILQNKTPSFKNPHFSHILPAPGYKLPNFPILPPHTKSTSRFSKPQFSQKKFKHSILTPFQKPLFYHSLEPLTSNSLQTHSIPQTYLIPYSITKSYTILHYLILSYTVLHSLTISYLILLYPI